MKSYQRVYAAVNLDTVRANMEAFRRHVPKEAMLCAVIKTDGYGLGAVPIAQTVDDLVWGYATATIDEALNLRRNGIKKPILVLGFVPEERYPELIQEKIRFAAFQEKQVKELSVLAAAMGQKAYVHIKTDTGMGRIGLPPEEVTVFAKKLQALPGIVVEGLFSHLATADMIRREGAWKQAARFRKLMAELESARIWIPICHIGNSAASMEMLQVPGNMFRVGIALYGYYPSDEMDKAAFALQPAMELKSTAFYLKKVPAGTPVGYGASYVTERETTIATVSIGYGDGYPRALSNCGAMLVRGHRAPIIGRVCMDQVMLDVTDIPGVCEGDPVTVIGRDGENEITAEEVAALAGSFNYELLCDLGKRIPRVYFRHGEMIGSKDYFEDDWLFSAAVADQI